jgi:ethanolamine utilization protein EutM
MPGSAIGLIETRGLLGAIAALDSSLKAAQVQLVSFSAVRGGRINFVLGGEVAAVASAVDAGCMVAEGLGCLRGSHVIPRPAGEVEEMLRLNGMKLGEAEGLTRAGACYDASAVPLAPLPPGVNLEGLHTTELRRMLRDFNDGAHSGREISKMRKEQLLEIIGRKFLESGQRKSEEPGK